MMSRVEYSSCRISKVSGRINSSIWDGELLYIVASRKRYDFPPSREYERNFGVMPDSTRSLSVSVSGEGGIIREARQEGYEFNGYFKNRKRHAVCKLRP
jgi:hypothetical protein